MERHARITEDHHGIETERRRGRSSRAHCGHSDDCFLGAPIFVGDEHQVIRQPDLFVRHQLAPQLWTGALLYVHCRVEPLAQLAGAPYGFYSDQLAARIVRMWIVGYSDQSSPAGE